MSKEQNNGNHVSEHGTSQKIEVISDEVLEHIYSDFANLRELLERNRAVTELTQSLVQELRKEVQTIQAVLKLNN